MARRGELEQEDHYWHEGMEDWLPLPDFVGREAWVPETAEPAPALNYRVILGSIAGAVIVIAGIGFLLIKPGRSDQTAIPNLPASDVATDLQVKDKALAELLRKIERLPKRGAPPLNTFYYDVAVDLNPTISTRTPWSAEIRGSENVTDLKGEKTLAQTTFVLTADYQDGEWVYKHYRATASNMVENTITEIDDAAASPVPPSVVGMLGLKRGGAPKGAQPTVSKVPGFK